MFLQKSKSKLSRELSDLVVYCKSVHFHGFEEARLHGKCYEMSSFSESKAKKLAKDAGTKNLKEQQLYFERVEEHKIIVVLHVLQME